MIGRLLLDVGNVEDMGRPVVADPPSFLAQVRRPALGVITVSVLVVLLSGVRYAGESDGRWLDDTALRLLREWIPVRRGARMFIDIYDPVPFAVIIVLLAGTCLLLHRRRLAVLAVVGPVLTGVATTVLKELIGRTKSGDLAYPSGHGGSATALALVLGLLLVSLVSVPLWAALGIVAGVTVLIGGGTAVAMTLANYHYLTDTLGGFCVAVAVVLGSALLIERWPWRRRGDPGRGDPGRGDPAGSSPA